MHILSVVTDNNPSWIRGREENGGRNYFMINLHESVRPDQDGTHNPRICSQTHICSQTCDRLRYVYHVHYIYQVSIMQICVMITAEMLFSYWLHAEPYCLLWSVHSVFKHNFQYNKEENTPSQRRAKLNRFFIVTSVLPWSMGRALFSNKMWV